MIDVVKDIRINGNQVPLEKIIFLGESVDTIVDLKDITDRPPPYDVAFTYTFNRFNDDAIKVEAYNGSSAIPGSVTYPVLYEDISSVSVVGTIMRSIERSPEFEDLNGGLAFFDQNSSWKFLYRAQVKHPGAGTGAIDVGFGCPLGADESSGGLYNPDKPLIFRNRSVGNAIVGSGLIHNYNGTSPVVLDHSFGYGAVESYLFPVDLKVFATVEVADSDEWWLGGLVQVGGAAKLTVVNPFDQAYMPEDAWLVLTQVALSGNAFPGFQRQEWVKKDGMQGDVEISLSTTEAGVSAFELKLYSKDGGLLAKDRVKVTVWQADIDLDTNNDDEIDDNNDGEDQYEQYEPDLLLDRWDALAEASGQLKEIKLSGFPPGMGLNAKLTKTGDAILRIHLGNDPESAQLSPCTVWTDAKSPPESLWVQGRTNGTALLQFSVYDPAKPTETITSDEVCLTVLEPASYSPGGGSFAAIWAPLKTNDNLDAGNNVGWGDAWIINDVLKSQGWTQVKWYEDLTGDTDLNLGTCTIENYLNMRNAGVMCVTASHGSSGSHSAVYAPLTFPGYQLIQSWCTNQTGMRCRSAATSTNGPGYYYAEVSSDWMSENWKTQLDANRAVTVFSICYSATESSYRESVKEAAGGRWRIGYLGTTRASEDELVNNEFFRNMNGKLNNGSRRTAGAAYNGGQGYTPNVKMDGNPWTTLCPTLCENEFATYPSSTVDNRKGWGCLIFDTYMDSTVSASQIIAATPNITKLSWVEVGAGKRAVGFNFQKTAAPWFMDVKCHTENGRSEGAGGGRSVDWDGIAPNGESSQGWFF